MIEFEMTEIEILKRKIHLKGQALKVIKAERIELIYKLILTRLKQSYEAQIKEEFDPELSQKLDCVIYLLENWK